MTTLALVTARGGSVGFPGKNLAHLAGRPLAAWAHRAVAGLRARRRDVLIHLSTDSQAIAEAWPEADRPATLRPAHLATGTATSLDVVLHALDTCGTNCDRVLLLQPTSPLIDSELLEQLLAALDAGAGSAMAVTAYPHPTAWALVAEQGRLRPLDPALANRRRQDLPEALLPCGAYAIRVDVLRERRAFLDPGHTVAVPVPSLRAVDIDHAIDLDLAIAASQHLHPERPFALSGRTIGGGAPCFIIAEAGVNHDGDPDDALALVRAAHAAGADAVKFQTFRASELTTASAPRARYQAANLGQDGSQQSMLTKLELPEDALVACQRLAAELGMVFLSTPFDLPSLELLDRLDVPGFKLGSGEMTNLPFLARIAALGRPLLISTGMSDLDEVEAAVATIRAHGDPPTAWLHCVSCYPAPIEHTNLRAMDSLRSVCGGPIGMSDHSSSATVSVAAVARGAQVLEKHLTLDRSRPGPDHAASLEPAAFADLVRQVRMVEQALGDGVKRPMPSEADTAKVARRSLVAARDVAAGSVLTIDDLACKRPGTGIAPTRLAEVLGRRVLRPIAADELLSWDALA